ncbi:11509_t:CDS:1 [Paraglomus brasilianum]|uniref:11509_t:CDS:1 n=1 Tax=Paraglomus brasilianum TaxID=144538 RepID=A0A9N9F4Y7_9GLOM|nr:11509_t:CDS:1 [Paraglomus brasilianum]
MSPVTTQSQRPRSQSPYNKPHPTQTTVIYADLDNSHEKVIVQLTDGAQIDFPVPSAQDIRDRFFYRKAKSSEKPARPPNKFFIFRTMLQGSIDALKLQVPIVSGLASEVWKKSSDDVKELFTKLAARAKAEHSEINPGYVYKPFRRNSNESADTKGKSEDVHDENIERTKAETIETAESAPSSPSTLTPPTTFQSIPLTCPSDGFYVRLPDDIHKDPYAFDEQFGGSHIYLSGCMNTYRYNDYYNDTGNCSDSPPPVEDTALYSVGYDYPPPATFDVKRLAAATINNGNAIACEMNNKFSSTQPLVYQSFDISSGCYPYSYNNYNMPDYPSNIPPDASLSFAAISSSVFYLNTVPPSSLSPTSSIPYSDSASMCYSASDKVDEETSE